MVTTVVFDADDTLIDIDPAVHSAQLALLAELDRLPTATGRLTIDQLQADDAVAFAELPAAPIEQIRRASMARSLARIGCSGELDRLLERFFAHRLAATRLYDGVPEVLARLRDSYVLGYGTNGNSRAHQVGLGDVFAFTVYAHVDGVPPKPALGFFEAVVKAAGVAPESVVHVGDDWANDVVGAATAGLRTVWLNRAGAPRPAGEPVVAAEIRSLAELPEVLPGLLR